MKKMLAVLLAILALVITAACGNSETAGSTKEDKIVVQVWGGTYEDTLRKYAIPIFEKQTGAKVEVITGAAPLSQLATEGESASVDVLNLDDSEVIKGTQMNLLETLDKNKLTNSKDLYKEAFRHPTAFVSNWGVYGLCYRTDLVSKAPVSWNDMWDQEYAAGKLGFYDYTIGGGFEIADMLAKMEGADIADTNSWDKAFGKLASLKPNIGLLFGSYNDAVTMLKNGDLKMATFTNGQALKLKEQGVPVAFVMPKEGVPAMTSLVGITKNSKHKELAYKLVDILLSPEVQKAYAENNYYAPSNAKTEIADNIKPFMPYGQEAISKLLYMDSEKLETVKNKLIEKWEEVLH